MAGASGDRNESLKETILESLTAILSPDHVTRSNGEDQIKALEVTEGMFVVFFSLYLDANLASVSQFWNPHVSVAHHHGMLWVAVFALGVSWRLFLFLWYLTGNCWICKFGTISNISFDCYLLICIVRNRLSVHQDSRLVQLASSSRRCF